MKSKVYFIPVDNDDSTAVIAGKIPIKEPRVGAIKSKSVKWTLEPRS